MRDDLTTRPAAGCASNNNNLRIRSDDRFFISSLRTKQIYYYNSILMDHLILCLSKIVLMLLNYLRTKTEHIHHDSRRKQRVYMYKNSEKLFRH